MAFKMMNIADGGFAEDLDIMLGQLIRVDPRLFLGELKRSGRTVTGGLVGNFGGEYVDKMKAQQLEITMRIAALQSVRDPELRAIRDRCVKELKRSEVEVHAQD